MECEICGKQVSKENYKEIIFQSWLEPKLPIAEYVCPECEIKIKTFIGWLRK